MKQTILSSALILILSHAYCSDAEAKKSACPVPNGVKCMSTGDVYNATNNASEVTSADQANTTTSLPPAPVPTVVVGPVSSVPATAPKGQMVYMPTEYASLAIKGDALSVVAPQKTVPITNTASKVKVAPAEVSTFIPSTTIVTNGYEPFREPAKILQIYIAAWQDDTGDLHLSERIVTEIVPRRWNIGVDESGAGDNYHLLEFPNVTAPTATGSAKSGG